MEINDYETFDMSGERNNKKRLKKNLLIFGSLSIIFLALIILICFINQEKNKEIKYVDQQIISQGEELYNARVDASDKCKEVIDEKNWILYIVNHSEYYDDDIIIYEDGKYYETIYDLSDGGYKEQHIIGKINIELIKECFLKNAELIKLNEKAIFSDEDDTFVGDGEMLVKLNKEYYFVRKNENIYQEIINAYNISEKNEIQNYTIIEE